VTLTRHELFDKFKELKSKVYETILKNDEKGFKEFSKKFYSAEQMKKGFYVIELKK
jgi:hypothetical protein